MSLRKKQLIIFLVVMFSLGVLSVTLFACSTFSLSIQNITPPVIAALRNDAGIVKLYSSVKIGCCVDFKIYDRPTVRSDIAFSAQQNAKFSLRNDIPPFRLRVILAARTRRYISKSVLNI